VYRSSSSFAREQQHIIALDENVVLIELISDEDIKEGG